MVRIKTLVVCLAMLAAGRAAAAQTQESKGRLLVTVVDQTGAVLPNAKVTLAGQDDATKPVPSDPHLTSATGLATIDGLPLGRYIVQAEFPGFETTIVRDVR